MPVAPAAAPRHPRGLAVLFLTEMWERFSFYGMRSLLVLYMTGELLQPGNADGVWGFPALEAALESAMGPMSVQAISSQIYGIYSSLLFLTPLAGGLLADRWLGQRRSVLLGGVIMAAGHFLMAFHATFLLALLCIIIGNGCFKPNVTAQVGGLYAPGDSRRDRAYSIFYVGINLGGLLAPAVCGTLGELYGWHYGFTVAGAGMLIGLAVFIAGRRYLPPDAVAPVAGPRVAVRAAPGDRRAVAALCLVALTTTLFWATYEQQGNTLVLWIRDSVDRSFFGLFDLKVTWFQSVNPLFIFALTPLVLDRWARQSRRGTEPGPIAKMATGCFLAAAAYALLTLAAAGAGAHTPVSWLWVIGYFLLLTLGELFISPIALSLFSRAAPPRLLSMMIGVWFLSGVVGNFLAGLLGSRWELVPKPWFWGFMAAVALVAGCVMLALRRPLERIIDARPTS